MKNTQSLKNSNFSEVLSFMIFSVPLRPQLGSLTHWPLTMFAIIIIKDDQIAKLLSHS